MGEMQYITDLRRISMESSEASVDIKVFRSSRRLTKRRSRDQAGDQMQRDPDLRGSMTDVQTTIEEVSTLGSSISCASFQAELEQALQPLRSENSQLRKRLRSLNHQLKERERKDGKSEQKFDVSHVQAKYESLQSKYNGEREKNSRLQQEIFRLEAELGEVKTEKAKVCMQLSEKETDQMKIKHDWLHETTRLKKDLDSSGQRLEEVKHKCELLEREKHILQVTVQQRDTDLTRVQDLLHDFKNLCHAKSSPVPSKLSSPATKISSPATKLSSPATKLSSPATKLSSPVPSKHSSPATKLSPSTTTPSRLTRQALEEFNNSPQNTASTGHKSPIERLGLENPRTPGCSPKLVPSRTPGCSPKLVPSKESKRSTSERRDEKRDRSKRVTVKSPLGGSLSSSTPQKKHVSATSTTLDNSNISSVSRESRESRCSSPTLLSTNVPSASQVHGQVVMPSIPAALDSTASSVSTEASTITMTAVTARYQPSTLHTQLSLESNYSESILTKERTESDRYSATDYFHKYGASAADRSDLDGTTFLSNDDSKSDITLMTNTSVSSISSQDDRSFRAGLANLDANIARLQMALRSAPTPR